jgi:DNA-binding IclR family transcriptional regulator
MRRREAAAPLAGSQDSRDVDSLNRGLEILRTFRALEGALGVAEIAMRLGIPRGTVQRLAETLVAHGFLRRIPDSDRYQPDSSCLLLGHAVLASSPIVRVARPILEELAARHDVHAALGVPERLNMMCLVHAAGPKTAPISLIGVGMPLPMTATALGRAWLWAQQGSTQGEFIQRTKAEGGDSAARTIPGLYRAFQELEEEGFCIASGEWIRDVAAVGTAVALNSGRSYGLACKVAGLGSRRELLRTKIAPALMEAAAQIRDASARVVA